MPGTDTQDSFRMPSVQQNICGDFCHGGKLPLDKGHYISVKYKLNTKLIKVLKFIKEKNVSLYSLWNDKSNQMMKAGSIQRKNWGKRVGYYRNSYKDRRNSGCFLDETLFR